MVVVAIGSSVQSHSASLRSLGYTGPNLYTQYTYWPALQQVRITSSVSTWYVICTSVFCLGHHNKLVHLRSEESRNLGYVGKF